MFYCNRRRESDAVEDACGKGNETVRCPFSPGKVTEFEADDANESESEERTSNKHDECFSSRM